MNRRDQGLLVGLFILCFFSAYPQTTISYDNQYSPLEFAITHLAKSLPHGLKRTPIGSHADIEIELQPHAAAIQPGGYRLIRKSNGLSIIGTNATGAMYGVLDVAEQLSMGNTLNTITEKTINPHFTVRAIKFNLPWSPYRTGPAMSQHIETCRDLKFWQSFLDQMALNRFNTLSLWNVHPFSFMVKPTHFPEANRFSEKEMADWKHFWTALFRMARDRGIETFIVNWNIAVSPEFADFYHVKERNDTSAIVKKYTREVVKQVLDEYPDLTGIGITLADWMSNFRGAGSPLPEMTPKDREDWIEETVVAGIKTADHPVKFIHRSVLSSDPGEMRRVINNARLKDTTLVEVKFNWSHGHSTPELFITHDSHSGAKDDGYWNPVPDNYRIEWMIRNEDFFILRWGQPDFIRKHISTNSKPYVNGYFVGSEGYIPAKDYSHLPGPHVTWKYAFEKQWLFYMSWGRLLYDPSTSDEVFQAAFASRYGVSFGNPLLSLYGKVSKVPLRLASFYRSTWDYTLYSEGFLSPSPSSGLNDKASAFISIDELIDHPTLDPELQSISDYVKNLNEPSADRHSTSPLALADSLEADGLFVSTYIGTLATHPTRALACELDDAQTWAELGLYFADKLRAAVALQIYRTTGEKSQQQRAIDLLKKCRDHWSRIAGITSRHYREVPFIDDRSDAATFSWSKYMSQVERDIELAGK